LGPIWPAADHNGCSDGKGETQKVYRPGLHAADVNQTSRKPKDGKRFRPEGATKAVDPARTVAGGGAWTATGGC
jgi:hypothetical protein